MTKEEAKKMGATHINQSEYYFRNINGTNCEMYNPHDQVWFDTYVSVFDVFTEI